MTQLFKNDEFIQRVSRIKGNPIAEYLIKLKMVDESAKGYVNYIGVSRDNPMFISYMDKTRVERYGTPIIKEIIKWDGNLKIKFRRSAFTKYFSRGKTITKKASEFRMQSWDWTFPDVFRIKYQKEFQFKLSESLVGDLNSKVNVQVKTWKELCKLLDIKQPSEIWLASSIGYAKLPIIRWSGAHPEESMVNIPDMLFDHIKYISPEIVTEVTYPVWDADKRQHASAGKVIKRIIGEKFKELFLDKDLEQFVSQYKYQACKELGSTGEFLYEEAQGEDIKKYYLEDNYFKLTGELGSSCMRYEKCQRYFGLYTLNTKHVSMGTLLKDGKVAARCILWYPKTKEDQSEKYFDRIYSCNENAFSVMKIYMEANGYKDIYSGTNDPVKILLDYGEYQITFFPYVDSMRSILGKELSNTFFKGSHTLDSQDGGPFNYDDVDEEEEEEEDGGDYSDCDSCGESTLDDDLRYINHGNHRGGYLCSDCRVYCEDISEYVDREEAIYDDINRHYIYFENSVKLYDDRHTHYDNTIELHNGEYCDDGDDTTEDVDGNVYLTHTIEEFCIEHEKIWYPLDHSDVRELPGSYVHKDSDEYQEHLANQSQLEIPFEPNILTPKLISYDKVS